MIMNRADAKAEIDRMQTSYLHDIAVRESTIIKLEERITELDDVLKQKDQCIAELQIALFQARQFKEKQSKRIAELETMLAEQRQQKEQLQQVIQDYLQRTEGNTEWDLAMNTKHREWLLNVARGK